MTAHAFVLPDEDEERNELEAMVGFALTPSTSDAQLDSIASGICRQLGRLQSDLARYNEAAKAEHLRIDLFYNARRERLDTWIAQLQEMGAEVARRATFPGKSKSRSVAFGSYGSRKIPEKVEIVDEEKARGWLGRMGNSAVFRTKVEIDKAVAKTLVLANLNATGETPEGFNHVAEREAFFVKAD